MNGTRTTDGALTAPDSLTGPADSLTGPPVALIDLLDRLLTGGAVLTGDLVLSIADVDLVHIDLRAVIRSVTGEEPAPW
ncbi:gas vesicle protein [Streptomyces sp. NPDC020472]|uniref:gas vesicle protein n=1 Tax=unclassified Streptomyces TaxID=2593676 RepID=UPI00367F7BEC